MTRTHLCGVLVLLLLVTFSARGGTVPMPKVSPPAVHDARADVESAMQDYARLQAVADSEGLAAFFTQDGELLEPGMDALNGRDAIRKFLNSFADVRIEWASMTSGSIDVWGDAAVQWGSYAQRVTLPGKPAEEHRGRYVAQWSRQASGKWLIRRLMMQPSGS
jgi:uncharacterized protein (TIGR02246 family)